MKTCPICQRQVANKVLDCANCGYSFTPEILANPITINQTFQPLEPLPMNKHQKRDLLFFALVWLGFFIMAIVWSIVAVVSKGISVKGAIILIIISGGCAVLARILHQPELRDVQSGVVQQAICYLEQWDFEFWGRDWFKHAQFAEIGSLKILRTFPDYRYPAQRWYRIVYSPNSQRLWEIHRYHPQMEQ